MVTGLFVEAAVSMLAYPVSGLLIVGAGDYSVKQLMFESPMVNWELLACTTYRIADEALTSWAEFVRWLLILGTETIICIATIFSRSPHSSSLPRPRQRAMSVSCPCMQDGTSSDRPCRDVDINLFVLTKNSNT